MPGAGSGVKAHDTSAGGRLRSDPMPVPHDPIKTFGCRASRYIFIVAYSDATMNGLWVDHADVSGGPMFRPIPAPNHTSMIFFVNLASICVLRHSRQIVVISSGLASHKYLPSYCS